MFTAGDPEGRRRSAAHADASACYACPECGEELQLRKGAVRAPHFAHRPGTGCAFVWRQTELRRGALRVDDEQQRLFDVDEGADVVPQPPDGSGLIARGGPQDATLFDGLEPTEPQASAGSVDAATNDASPSEVADTEATRALPGGLATRGARARPPAPGTPRRRPARARARGEGPLAALRSWWRKRFRRPVR